MKPAPGIDSRDDSGLAEIGKTYAEIAAEAEIDEALDEAENPQPKMEFTAQTQEERLHDVPDKFMRDVLDSTDQAMAENVAEVHRVANLPSVKEVLEEIIQEASYHLSGTSNRQMDRLERIEELAKQGLEVLNQ